MKSLLAAFLLTITSFAFAANPDAFFLTSDTQHAERFAALTKEIRCVVCQNQNLADSDAPLANDLRKKIYTMLLDNKSDSEIKEYLVHRYGEFILLKPRFSKLTLCLWLFPFVGIVGILYFLYRKTSIAIASAST